MNTKYAYVLYDKKKQRTSMHMYDNMQYALHSGEVPVTSYSVSVKAERNVVHWLFISIQNNK